MTRLRNAIGHAFLIALLVACSLAYIWATDKLAEAASELVRAAQV